MRLGLDCKEFRHSRLGSRGILPSIAGWTLVNCPSLPAFCHRPHSIHRQKPVRGSVAIWCPPTVAMGIYGVIAYSVVQRANEFGIRTAPGAAQRDVVKLVLGEGVVVTGIGIALGLLAGIRSHGGAAESASTRRDRSDGPGDDRGCGGDTDRCGSPGLLRSQPKGQYSGPAGCPAYRAVFEELSARILRARMTPRRRCHEDLSGRDPPAIRRRFSSVGDTFVGRLLTVSAGHCRHRDRPEGTWPVPRSSLAYNEASRVQEMRHHCSLGRRSIATTSFPPKVVPCTVIPTSSKSSAPASCNSSCIVDVLFVASNRYS